ASRRGRLQEGNEAVRFRCCDSAPNIPINPRPVELRPQRFVGSQDDCRTARAKPARDVCSNHARLSVITCAYEERAQSVTSGGCIEQRPVIFRSNCFNESVRVCAATRPTKNLATKKSWRRSYDRLRIA